MLNTKCDVPTMIVIVGNPSGWQLAVEVRNNLSQEGFHSPNEAVLFNIRSTRWCKIR